jgi:hypothetical protein
VAETRTIRKLIAISLVMLCCAAGGSICFAQDETPKEPRALPEEKPVADKHELFRKYIVDSLGPEGVLGAALTAGFDQVRNSPIAWGDGTPGYSKRWASNYAESAIGDTTKYALARMLHQDPSFQRCQCTGFGPRLGHAVTSVFKARNVEGEWVWSPAVGAGIVASSVIPAATWYPYESGTRDGLKHTGTAIASKIGVRVFREFVHIPRVFQ